MSAVGGTADDTGRSLSREVLRLVLWTAAFVAAGYVGRATIIDGRSLSLVWPAAGVAGLWIAGSARERLPWDLACLAVATFVVNSSTGASPQLAVVFVVTNVAQVLAFASGCRSWSGDTWGFGGRTPLQELGALGKVSVVALGASLLGAALGQAGLALVGADPSVSGFVVWWGRNAVGLIVLVALGLLAGPPLAAARSGRERLAVVREAVSPASGGRLIEAALLVAASAVLVTTLFLAREAHPLAFLLLVVAVWAGIRFHPVAVILHGIAMGSAGIVFTIAGHGPFAELHSVNYRAVVAQVFVAMTVLTGLALAFSRAETGLANRRLAAAERESAHRADLLDTVLESLQEGVIVIGPDGHSLLRNQAATRILGLLADRVESAPADSPYGMFLSDGTPLVWENGPGKRALEGEVVPPMDVVLRNERVPQGRIVEVSAQPLPTDAERRAIVVMRDVTRERQERDTLASFAGVVAHDLGNPLTVIDGWVEALEEEFAVGDVAPSTGLPLLGRIHTATAHMRQFVADLLAYTVSRDQALRAGPVDLTATIRELEGTTTADSDVQVDDGLEVWADAALVRQLFDNLVANALKYVAAGTRPHVVVTGRPVDGLLEVRVADNGIGIPAEQREAVFETFHRAHPGKTSGTGLGLAICRRIVDRHGGSIHVGDSAPGAGTVIVVRLPRTAEAFAAATAG